MPNLLGHYRSYERKTSTKWQEIVVLVVKSGISKVISKALVETKTYTVLISVNDLNFWAKLQIFLFMIIVVSFTVAIEIIYYQFTTH